MRVGYRCVALKNSIYEVIEIQDTEEWKHVNGYWEDLAG